MKSKFDFGRFGRLCLNDIMLYKKSIILFSAFLVCFSFALHFLFLSNQSLFRWHTPLSSFSMIVLIILISFSFVEFENSGRRTKYFLLPASISEKYLSRFILTIFSYIILGLLSDLISRYLALVFIYRPRYGNNISMYYGSLDQFLTYLKIYILAHSVFFFGAVFYKRNSFIKTSISVLLIMASVLVWIKLIHSVTMPEAGVSFDISIDKGFFYSSEYQYMQFLKYRGLLVDVVLIFAFYILPPLLWVLGYFRLKEEEIADGIQ